MSSFIHKKQTEPDVSPNRSSFAAYAALVCPLQAQPHAALLVIICN